MKAGNLKDLGRKIRDYKKTAETLGIGEPTLRDIVKELEKPGRDPRDEMPRPILRSDVMDMKDLKPGMILKVMDVDLNKKRISLSMKLGEEKR